MRFRAFLLCTVAVMLPAVADAAPVLAFASGIAAGFTGAISPFAVGAFGLGGTIGGFLGQTVLGSLLLNVGISYLLAPKNKNQTPKIDDARVNSRIANAPRWIMGGAVARGGDAGPFIEFDDDGNLWYILTHGDSEIVGQVEYLLDGIPVELSDGADGFTAGDVLTDAFCLNSSGEQYEGTGTRVPVWRIYTVTPDAGSAYGAKPAAFTAAFPSLPSDFYGVGVSYSIIRGNAVKIDKRGNAYRWRGPIGVGEPSVSLYANFERMYDPRNPAHIMGDTATWTAGNGNPAIVWAWFRTNPRGRGQAVESINWAKISEWADIFDTTATNRAGDPVPLYRCGVAFPDNRPRHECEGDILATCDGFVGYDNEGKSYIVGGYYQQPTLTINAARDVFTAETQTVDDGETPMDGVVVEYISCEHNFTKQPSAPWVNTLHYDGVSEPSYMIVPVLGCQDHNQAVRLAKAIGLRQQPARRAAYGTTIKGILAKNERGIILNHDARFSGPFEIVTPVEEDTSGQLCRMAVVPLQSDRWTLALGEEGEPPQPTPILDIDTTLEVAQNVIAVAEVVQNSTGAAVRISVSFDTPARVDRFYRFRTARAGIEKYMTTDMDARVATSAIVDDGETYRVSWQTMTAGGRATVWSDERDVPVYIDVVATANPTAPAALVSAGASGGAGEATVSFTTANDTNQAAVAIYGGDTSTFGAASLITTVISPANVTGTATQTGLSAGTRYYWAIPQNGSGVSGSASGPYTAVIT